MRTIEGVSGALIHNDKVLLVRRSKDDDFLPGYYELPGGKIEPGETKEEAVIRELLEEVSLKVQIIKPYHEFAYQKAPNVRSVDYEYLVKLADDEDINNFKLSQEHDNFKWVGLDELDKVKPITPEKVTSLKIALAA